MLKNTTKLTIEMEEPNFKVGDMVKVKRGIIDEVTGIDKLTLDDMKQNSYPITNIVLEKDGSVSCVANGWWFKENQLELAKERKEDAKMDKELIREVVEELLNEKKVVPIKYHDDNMPRMIKTIKGNWTDCRVIEGGKVTFDIGTPNERKEKLKWIECDKELEDGTVEHTKKITYNKGDFLMLPLGFSINQGLGYEVNILPRSSTFKNFHIVQANSMAVGDDTFIGDGDMYHYPAIALADGEMYLYDRICQMQVNKTTNLELQEVDTLGDNENRSGFGSSGVR